jgi:hypothetical protein
MPWTQTRLTGGGHGRASHANLYVPMFSLLREKVTSQLELLRLVRIKEQDIDCPVKGLFVPQVPDKLGSEKIQCIFCICEIYFSKNWRPHTRCLYCEHLMVTGVNICQNMFICSRLPTHVKICSYVFYYESMYVTWFLYVCHNVTVFCDVYFQWNYLFEFYNQPTTWRGWRCSPKKWDSRHFTH